MSFSRKTSLATQYRIRFRSFKRLVWGNPVKWSRRAVLACSLFWVDFLFIISSWGLNLKIIRLITISSGVSLVPRSPFLFFSRYSTGSPFSSRLLILPFSPPSSILRVCSSEYVLKNDHFTSRRQLWFKVARREVGSDEIAGHGECRVL